MLLCLDRSLEQYVFSLAGQLEAFTDAVDLIARCSREGNHLVVGHPDVIRAVLARTTLSDRSRAQLKRIAQEWTEAACLLGKISVQVHILPPGTEISKSLHGGVKILRLPISFFDEMQKVLPVIWLVEDDNDHAILDKIAKFYSREMGFGGLAVRFEGMPGGGRNTSRRFETVKRGGSRFCLCIVDSDKKAPLSDLGDTAREVVALGPSTLTDHYVLDAHELENVLPDSFYREIYYADTNKSHSVETLEALTAGGHLVVRKYIDLKNGISLRRILEWSSGSAERAFWMAALEDVRNCAGRPSHGAACIADGACAQVPCTCFFLEAFGTRILQDVAARYSGRIPRRHVDRTLHPEWMTLGKMLFDWACGSQLRVS